MRKKTVKNFIENLAIKKAVEISNDEKLILILVDRFYSIQFTESSKTPRLEQ